MPKATRKRFRPAEHELEDEIEGRTPGNLDEAVNALSNETGEGVPPVASGSQSGPPPAKKSRPNVLRYLILGIKGNYSKDGEKETEERSIKVKHNFRGWQCGSKYFFTG